MSEDILRSQAARRRQHLANTLNSRLDCVSGGLGNLGTHDTGLNGTDRGESNGIPNGKPSSTGKTAAQMKNRSRLIRQITFISVIAFAVYSGIMNQRQQQFCWSEDTSKPLTRGGLGPFLALEVVSALAIHYEEFLGRGSESGAWDSFAQLAAMAGAGQRIQQIIKRLGKCQLAWKITHTIVRDLILYLVTTQIALIGCAAISGG